MIVLWVAIEPVIIRYGVPARSPGWRWVVLVVPIVSHGTLRFLKIIVSDATLRLGFNNDKYVLIIIKHHNEHSKV